MDDSDYLLALQLSDTFMQEFNRKHEKPLSIVDPIWELIDPLPDIRDLFVQFDSTFFDGNLAGVEVKWSSRMTLCAGLCCYERKGGLCCIKLSQPLLKLRPRRDLIETLLHEMIHALLFVTNNNKDHDGHGNEFHKHMNRINNQTGTKISVYHSFHDEVNNYRQHWWKCNGPCNKRPPYFGVVRRAMNRAPSPRDPWWGEHTIKCGGSFIKVKEPENYSNIKKDKNITEKTKAETATNTNLKNEFRNDLDKPNNKLIDWLSVCNDSLNTHSNSFSSKTIKNADQNSLKDDKIVKISSIDQLDKKRKFLTESNDMKSVQTPRSQSLKSKVTFPGQGYKISSSNEIRVTNNQAFLDELESKLKGGISKKRKKEDAQFRSINVSLNDDKLKNVIHIDDDNAFVECPACPAKVPEHALNAHLDICLK